MVQLQSFATAQQMAERSQGAIPADRPYLEDALAAASKRIRNYCGWHIFPLVTVTDLRVRALAGHHLHLPTTHLVSVTAISNTGVPIVDVDAIDWFEDGVIDYTAWSRPTVISFTHGYDEAPPDLVDLTLELATGELQSAGGAIREQTLASSVTWARPSGRLTRDDKNDLQEYRLGYLP